MSLKVERILADLGADEVDLQILALTTIPRMSRATSFQKEELGALVGGVQTALQSDNSDVVFLARKALNVLESFDEPTPSSAPEAVPSETVVPDDSVDAEQNEHTVIRSPNTETQDLERLLVTEEDPRRLATLLTQLVSSPCEDSILHRIVPLLSHDDARVRANAVEVFEASGSSRHIQFILPLVSDPNNRVRSNAIKALAIFGHPQARHHLMAMIGSDEVSMRESAVYTLCNLKSPEYFDLLVEVLADPYEGIRRRAAEALASFDAPEAIEALKSRVSDEDESVRSFVIDRLTEKGVDVKRLIEAARIRTSPPTDPLPPPVITPLLENDGKEERLEKDHRGCAEGIEGDVEERLFRAVVGQIGRDLKLREQKARLSRVLFRLGITAYERCRSSEIKDVPLVVVYYEILKYQEYLQTLAARIASTEGQERATLESSVGQYKNRMRDAFIKLGRLGAEGSRDGGDILPPSKELDYVLKTTQNGG